MLLENDKIEGIYNFLRMLSTVVGLCEIFLNSGIAYTPNLELVCPGKTISIARFTEVR